MSRSHFEEEMEYLHSLSQFMPSKVVSGELELGLDAIGELLARLGNPEKDLNIIHVAGTNGKGSTIAFLSSILNENGYRTGVYTSPVLVRVTEQIRIFDEDVSEISEDELADYIAIIRPHIEDMKAEGHKLPSEFEAITALAFVYFKDKNCDFVILECGMGGRTDATNVIESSLLSIITAIGLDHTEILGDSLKAIAGEKAGIIKAGGKALVLEGDMSVMDVFGSTCMERDAELNVAKYPNNLRVAGTDGQIFDCAELSDVFIPFLGGYQTINASIAIKAAYILDRFGYAMTEDRVRRGLANASWPCRFEIVHRDPVVIADGSHNADGVSSMLKSFDAVWPGRKIIFIVGVLRDKSYAQMLGPVIPYAKSFHTVTVPSKRALDADELKQCISDLSGGDVVNTTSHQCIHDAIEAAINEAEADDIICAFGSLYYAGHVKEYFNN